MQIGLLFGSFNPVHNGHLILAQHLLSEEGLDEIWFVLSPHNPLKNAEQLAEVEHRKNMLGMALVQQSKFRLCNAELQLPTPSYTIHTIKWLTQQYPNHAFHLLIGTDNLAELHLWKSHQQLLDNYQFLVYPRPGSAATRVSHPHVKIINAPLIEVSSTNIRERLQSGKSIAYYVPKSVSDYIIQNNLYTNLR